MICDDLKLNIKLDDSFFEPEERCGFLVTRKRKELWAVLLDLLSELQRVCDKNGLKVFADGGTLLGAIRHKGFIPWDDDLDLMMTRDDYNKLRDIGQKELREGYFLQSTYSDALMLPHLKLRKDDSTMMIASDYNRYHHQGAFIDIFVLDNLPENRTERNRLRAKLHRKYRALLEPISKRAMIKRAPFVVKCYRLAWNLTILPFRKIKYALLYRHNPEKRMASFNNWDKLCSSYNHKTKYVGNLAFKCIFNWFNPNKKMFIVSEDGYKKDCMLKFENISIRCPANYKEILTQCYGNYMKFVIGNSVHGCVFIDLYNSYKKYQGLSRKKFRHLFDTNL